MLMPDVNVLIYAHRADDPDHVFYRSWFQQLLVAETPFALSTLVAISFVRIVTQARFKNPTPLEAAFEVMANLIEAPNCRFVGPSETHWFRVKSLCVATKTSGSNISDAQHAAVAIEHGCRLVSRDSDFERFAEHGLDFELLEP